MAVKNVKVQVCKMLSKAKKLNDIETRKKKEIGSSCSKPVWVFSKKIRNK
jgi:hypothetical protein